MKVQDRLIVNNVIEAVKNNIYLIEQHLNRNNSYDHSSINDFQNKICKFLQNENANISWEVERQINERKEKDSIDIYGKDEDCVWIIELDAARGDQVAKKLLSRIDLWGTKKTVKYIALLYPQPSQTGGKAESEKYTRYGNDILKRINRESFAIGLYIDFEKGSNNYFTCNKCELWDNTSYSCFVVKYKGYEINAKSMNDCARKAVEIYMKMNSPKSFDVLKKKFGRYVLDIKGKSREKEIKVNNMSIFIYSQFRENEKGTWIDFVKICGERGVVIEKRWETINLK